MPETAELEQQSQALVVRASTFAAIQTAANYRDAVDVGRALRAMRKGLEDFWAPLKQKAHSSWKEIVATEKEMIDPVEAAYRSLDVKIGQYLAAEEQKRLESERVAQQAALESEQNRLLRESATLSELGQHQEADKVLDEAVNVSAPPVILPSSVPKVSGVAQRTIWRWRIKDASQIKREYMTPDELKISQIVRALKGSAASTVGGIEVWEEKAVSMRT